MKRVRCPKCDHYIIFDETRYEAGQQLVFKCEECGREFGIRIGVSKLRSTQKDENRELDSTASAVDNTGSGVVGQLVVIENVFHYKQLLPLHMGDNVVGRYQKGNPINTPFETVDPSVDLNHCTVNVSYDKQKRLKYTLADNNSNTGTFVDNVELRPRERRVIGNGTLFSIGATSILLKTSGEED